MSEREDKQDIGEVVHAWALARDTGNWAGLRAAFHRDGQMTATWFSGTVDEFVARSKAAWERGARVGHFMSGSVVRLNGRKALARSKFVLHTRYAVDGVDVDVTCYGWFLDRFVKDADRWYILRRNGVYEKDRLEPVRPGDVLRLDEALLAGLPEGYRYLGYTQAKAGMTVDRGLPTPRSPALETLVRDAEDWLAS